MLFVHIDSQTLRKLEAATGNMKASILHLPPPTTHIKLSSWKIENNWKLKQYFENILHFFFFWRRVVLKFTNLHVNRTTVSEHAPQKKIWNWTYVINFWYILRDCEHVCIGVNLRICVGIVWIFIYKLVAYYLEVRI